MVLDVGVMSNTLFRRLGCLDHGYLPDPLLHREAEMQNIAMCLSPVLQGHQGIHVKIHGSPATGKTTAVQKILAEFSSQSHKIACAYVNVRLNPSRQAIFAKIYRELNGVEVVERGLPFKKVYAKVFTKLEKKGKGLVVALDDADHAASEVGEAVYQLLRCGEDNYDVNVTLIVIASKKRLRFDGKVNSCFNPVEIYFRPYTVREVFSILRRRAEKSFSYNAVSPLVLKHISDTAADLRQALELLKLTGILACDEGADVVTKEHVEQALALQQSRPRARRDILGEEEGLLLESLPATSGELYEKAKEYGMSQSACYRALKKLEKKKMITCEYIKGMRGRTRRFTAVLAR